MASNRGKVVRFSNGSQFLHAQPARPAKNSVFSGGDGAIASPGPRRRATDAPRQYQRSLEMLGGLMAGICILAIIGAVVLL